MSGEGTPPSVKRAQEKAALSLAEALGVRQYADGRGMPRIRFIVLFVGFTAVLVLFAVFVNWIWWIPAGIFVFMLVMMSFAFLMMRRGREKKKGFALRKRP